MKACKKTLSAAMVLLFFFFLTLFYAETSGLSALAVTVPGISNTQRLYVENWAEVSSVQQFAYKNEGPAYAYETNGKLVITTPGKTLSVDMKYPLLGDVISDDDGNFYVVWGREGNSETEETMFISKYSPDGNHIKTTGFTGECGGAEDFNTQTPFSAGNCTSVINDGKLMVYYARLMYNGHQSSNAIGVNIFDMSPFGWGDWRNIPYVSHSFDQSVIWSEHAGGFVYADHGDARPRGFVITVGVDSNQKNLFNFHLPKGSIDMLVVNKTFAQMGNLVETSAGVVLTGASAKSIGDDAANESQNLFIQIFNPLAGEVLPSMFIGGETRSDGTATYLDGYKKITDYGVRWLTDYNSKSVVAPQAVEADDYIVILWSTGTEYSYEEYTDSESFYMVLTAYGNVYIPPTSLGKTPLNSFERPLYYNGSVYWASAKDGVVEIQSISNVLERKNIKTEIPDEKFEAAVRGVIGKQAGDILLSDVEHIKTLDVSGKGINSLSGIEYFAALEELYCGNNKLLTLDVSNNSKLKKLVCPSNRLASINTLGCPELITLECGDNVIISLDVSKNTRLKTLDCRNNYIPYESDVIGLNKSVTSSFNYSPQVVQGKLEFADPIFEEMVREYLYVLNDNEIHISQLAWIPSIDVSYMGISSLSGIEYFANLNTLNCSDNELTSIDVSKNTRLTVLDCNYNKLTSLDVSENAELSVLDCSRNLLTSLNVSKCTALSTLTCTYNNLASEAAVTGLSKTASLSFYPQRSKGEVIILDSRFEEALRGVTGKLSGNLLKSDLSGITSLDVSDLKIKSLAGIGYLTALKELVCNYNRLTTLDLTNNTDLEYLNCSSNYNLTTLDLTKNTKLLELRCTLCGFASLDVSKNTALTYIQCIANLLTELDVSNNTELESLSCGNNRLSTLDLTNNKKLRFLLCCYNFFESEASIIGMNTDFYYYYEFEPQLTRIIFNDPVLEEAVCKAVGKQKGDVVLDTDVLYLSYLDVSNMGIKDMTGVSSLPSLESLYCSSNQITELDVSGCTALVYLDVSNNQLESLDVSNNKQLSHLSCRYNLMESVSDVSLPAGFNAKYLFFDPQTTIITFSDPAFEKAVLEALGRSSGTITEKEIKNLTSLDVSNKGIKDITGIELFTSLEYLNCSNNLLTSLSISDDMMLSELDCSGNQLSELDLGDNYWLTVLNCENNLLTELDLESVYELFVIDCSGNKLTALNLQNVFWLEQLDCSNNQLTSLDLSENPFLTTLVCANNSIRSEKYIYGLDKSITTELTFDPQNVPVSQSPVFSSNTWIIPPDYSGELCLDTEDNWSAVTLLGDGALDKVSLTEGVLTIGENSGAFTGIVKLINGKAVVYIGVEKTISVSTGIYCNNTWHLQDALTEDAVLSVTDMEIVSVQHTVGDNLAYDSSKLTVKSGTEDFEAIIKLKNKRTGRISYFGIAKKE